MLGTILIFIGIFLYSRGDSVYLAGNHGKNYGRVEVYTNYTIGTICDDNWDNTDARVVCGQLGLPTSYARALSSAALGSGSGLILMDEVFCRGTESNIASCRFPGYGENDCSHNEDAAVICQGSFLSIFFDGNHGTNFGRVQVVTGRNKSIGTVCDNEWDEKDATVVCRQLGHPTTNARAMTGAYFGSGTGIIWLDNVYCKGTEANLYSCSSNTLGINDCSHTMDAGVICGYSLQVRLKNMEVSGNHNRDGIIQVQFEGHWINVKYGNLSLNVLEVLCQQLGFRTANTSRESNYCYYTKVYRVRNEDSLFKNAQMITFVKCDGTETNIGHCQFTVAESAFINNPSSFDDANTTAYLVCEQTGLGTLKLLNNSHTSRQIIVRSGIPTDLVCVAGPSIPRQTITWNLTTDSNITETYQMSNTGRYTTSSRLTFIPDVEKHNGSAILCRLQSTYGDVRSVSESVQIFFGGTSVETATTDYSAIENSTLLLTRVMTESGDKNIYAYLTICLSIAVFICAVIIVVLILRVKRMQAENERQNSSEDNYNRRRLQTSTLDKRLEEETYENPGMSTEDVTDNQEHYEVLELREGDEKTSRAGENGKEFYVNTDIRN